MKHGSRANVSVIIPCYRCSETIERAVRSVIGQSMQPCEIILVDDASDDDGVTLSCLQQLRHTFTKSGEVPIHFISLQENTGPSGARNAAWDTATADFIAFLDADDAWHPKKIEIQYTWMAAHPGAALSGHHCRLMDAALLPTAETIPKWTVQPCDFRSALFRNQLMTRTVMMRRETKLRFSEDKRYSEDYLLWLQAMASGTQAFILDAVLAYSFKSTNGASGLSDDLWRMERGELDNFRRLYRTRAIGGTMYLAVSMFSFLKYLRRMINAAFRHSASSKSH